MPLGPDWTDADLVVLRGDGLAKLKTLQVR